MILCSTFRKLIAAGKSVYVVSQPAHTIARGALCSDPRFMSPAEDTTFPAWSESFATKAQAEHRINDGVFCIIKGAPAPTLTVMPAAEAAKLDKFYTALFGV